MLAFIIFGTRGVRSTIKEGQFTCPQCASKQPYKHKKVTQFFTLYFIPLIPLGKKGEYVECQRCRNTFIERVLNMQEIIDISEKQVEVPKIEAAKPQIAGAVAAAVAVEANAISEPSKAQVLSEKQKAIKKVLIMMILADGKVLDSEIHMFHKVYFETANTTVVDIYGEIDKVRTENRQPHQYLKSVSAYLNQEGKEDIIRASMMIAAADGDIDPAEVRMVENFGKSLDMRPAEVKSIIDSIK